jgi:hypothetical protein|tara:strand:+ start:1575 stop:1826 length:252 start_codon:yes stop_codon:yes gene_type:complete
MKNFDSNVITAISALVLILLITVVLLTSCTPPKKESQTPNLIADAEHIGRALGCMFGGCDRATQDREFQREFEKIDKSSVLKK